MRSRSGVAIAALLMGLLVPMPPTLAADAPTPQQIRDATETVYDDPDLHGLKAERVLRLRNRERETESERAPEWRWPRDLVAWIAEAGRGLMWLGTAVLAALLIVFLRRWIRVHGDAAAGRALALPSHVRDLDIRPESLPDDLPSAVRALWLRGEQRAALSLLYRGALSRLVHEHGLPVRASSTEGECTALAARHLDVEGGAFVARLIALWQAAVYGAHGPDAGAVLAVCDEFDARLPRRALAAVAAAAT